MAKQLKSLDPGKISQKSFSIQAEVQKNSESGLSWKPLGAASAAVRVGAKTPVMCFNSAGAVAFVAFGDQTIAAPTTGANGMPVLANSSSVYNSGDSEWIRASAGTVFVYTADPEINQ